MENVYGIEGTPELVWLKKTWSPPPSTLWGNKILRLRCGVDRAEVEGGIRQALTTDFVYYRLPTPLIA